MNTTNDDNLKKKTDEIDLLELFSILAHKISQFFNFIFRTILAIVVFLIRKSPILVLFAAAGVFIGYVLFSNSKRFYSSEMVAQPNGISNSDMINYINDLNKLCKEKNYLSLSQTLNLDDSIVNKIKDIQAFWIVDINKDGSGDYIDYKSSFNLKDTTQQLMEDRFQLRVEMFDNSAFGYVTEGLYYYISQNPYLKRLNEIRKDELKELISITSREINKLDSLQDVEYFQKSKQPLIKDNQINLVSEKETQLYYRDKLALISKKQEYEKELELSTEPITVIKNFTALAVAENPMMKYVVKYGIYMLSLGLLLIILFDYRKIILSTIFKK
ncbi:MAG: hypothetical protein JXJ22_13735 [Bacteroidales bacterium]|nr:hypothetical protein [Bacteroidales bacterium]